jgi:hypothetical protein
MAAAFLHYFNFSSTMVHSFPSQPAALRPVDRQRGSAFYLHKLVAFVLLLAGMGASHAALAQTFYDNAIVVTQQPSGSSATTVPYAGKRTDAPYNTYTRLGNNSASPIVVTPALGTYDLNNNSQLKIAGGSLIVSPAGRGTTYNGAQLNYRVYLTGSTQVPAYSVLNFTPAGTDSFGDPIFRNDNANVDLLSGLINGGNYTVDVQFSLVVDDGSNVSSVTDPSNASYTLTFYVTPPPVTPAGGTTTWQSTTANGGSTDWTLASNWSNGVPSATSNAVIPAKTNSDLVYPILNDPTVTYAVNNLTLRGNTSSDAAQMTIGTATLRVFGNINQPAGGLAGNTINNPGVMDPIRNSTLILAGADQIITGQLAVADIVVAGSGVKSVINILTPTNMLAFRPTSVTNGVIIQSAAQDASNGSVVTVFDTTKNSYLALLSSSSVSAIPGDAETNTSYVKGVMRADRSLTNGVTSNFGNIGLDLTPNHTPGLIIVYRVVGDPLTGPLASGAVPTKRFYQIQGDDNSANSGFRNSSLTAVFHYLNSADELNGIQESNLTLFSALQNGAPFTPAYGTLNQANKTVTRVALPSFPNFYLTLGDRTRPLPVSLTVFTATAAGVDANLAWTTATEKNSSGFEVQVSTNGTSYRKIAFVASKSPDSQQQQNYSFVDTEAGKTGTRYYRLRQIDLDGTESFSPVRTVNFSGNILANVTTAYPNPFTSYVDLNIDAATVGTAPVRVQLLDLTGRVVREQVVSVENASLRLNSLDGLRSGMYLAKVSLPNGTTETLRIQKQ